MLYGIRIKNKDNSKILKNDWKKDIMTMSESELRKFIEHNISQGKYFSCVVLYEKNEILAWHAALRIGEIITEYFKAIKGKQIKIHLNLNIATIVSQLNEMKHDDILLLNIIDQNLFSILRNYEITKFNEMEPLVEDIFLKTIYQRY